MISCFVIGFLLIIFVSIFYTGSPKNKFGWVDLASVGTFLQGIAAIAVVVFGILKGDEILTRIGDLKNILDGIRKTVEETYKVVKTYNLPPPPETPKNESSGTSNTTKLEESSLEGYWKNQLAKFPEARKNGEYIYIPDKEKVIRELSKPDGDKASTLKSAIRFNETLLPAGSSTANVNIGPTGEFDILIKKKNGP